MCLLFATIAILISSSLALAEEQSYDWVFPKSNLQMRVVSPFGSLPFSGYAPLEVTLKNSSSKPINVTFKTESTSLSMRGYRYTSNLDKSTDFQLSCPPMQSLKYKLNVPLARAQNQNSYYMSGSSSKFNNDLSFEVTLNEEYEYQTINGEFSKKYDNIAHSNSVYKKLPSLSKKSSKKPIEKSFEPSTLPTNLKAISGYDYFAIVMADWQVFSKTQQHHLMAWVSQGGQLFIVDNNKISADVLKNVLNENQLVFNEKKQEAQLSNGKIMVLSPKSLSSKLAKDFTTVNKGEIEGVKSLAEEGFGLSSWQLKSDFGSKSFGSLFLSIILIAFAILVAPVNFLILAPKGKRHKLLLTTPIISVGASLLLIFYIILSEGFGGEGRQLVHKELDSQRKKAYVTQEQISRTGVLLSNQFQLDNDYEIIQMPLAGSKWARVTSKGKSASESYNLRPGENMTTYNGNYYSARSEHAHLIKGTTITQESIQVTQKDNKYILISTLPHRLETLLFQTSEGKFYQASDIKTGVAVTAKPIGKRTHSEFLTETEKKFTVPLGRRIERLAARKNSFIALSTSAKGIETLKSIDWKTETLTTGILTFTNAQ